MIPSWAIHLGTVVVLAVGFALGWYWRGWRDRALAEEELRKRGVDPGEL